MQRCTTPRASPGTIPGPPSPAQDWALLAAAGAINLLSLAAKGWAWQLLVRPFGALTFRTAQSATFAGAAINAIGVAMSGEAGRIHLASARDSIRVGLITRSVVASRIVEAAALGIFLLGVVAGVTSEHGWRLLGGGVLLIGGALGLLRWLPWLRPGRGEGAAPGWTTAQLAAPLAINVGSWGLQWATYHCSIVATGALISPSLSVLALVLSNVGGLLRLTPGNVGVVQGAWFSASGRRGSRPPGPWRRGWHSRPCRCSPCCWWAWGCSAATGCESWLGAGRWSRPELRALAGTAALGPAPSASRPASAEP